MSAAVQPTSTQPEQNLVQMLMARAATLKTPAARIKQAGAWVDVSWYEVLARVRAVSDGLVGFGVKPGDRVAIFANTSLDWVVADLAISGARAVCVPIYASNTPDEVHYVLTHSGASVVFVDDDVPDAKTEGRVTRLRARLSDCPEVKAVVRFDGKAKAAGELSLDDLQAQGRGVGGFEARAAAIGPDELCHFIYTSGTTGNPKGVMLSHGNWAFEARALRGFDVVRPEDAMMLFLPLAHSFAQAAKAAWVSIGFTVVFAEAVEKVVQNLAETHPTIFPSVPRVFEKVFASVQAGALGAPGLKGKLARWAFGHFDAYVAAKEAGRGYDSLGWSLAKKLVFAKVKVALDAKLGGNLRLFISGGAPLSRKIAYFFDLLGIAVCEGYGLTETSAGATLNRKEGIRIGTVGLPFPGVELKFEPDGEILIRGPNIMQGYYRDEAASKEVMLADGWFATGDIGELDAEGMLRITDRKKDLIKTAGGKYIAPQNLENLLKGHAIVSSAMVYGDRRPYVSALFTVNEEQGRKLLTDAGEPAAQLATLTEHPLVKQALQAAVDEVNAQQPPYSTIKRFTVLAQDFSQETGELTPTLKVKRKVCTQKYAAQLDSMYDEKLLS